MNDRRGFALIVSTLIISTVLVLLAAAAALDLSRSQQTETATEAWLEAKWLAEGCAETALDEIQIDDAYAGNQTITIGTGSCTILPVLGGGTTVLRTEATVRNRTYRIRVELSSLDPLTILSWRRVPSF